MPATSVNLYVDGSTTGFAPGDPITLVSQVGEGTWTAANNGDITFDPPTPDPCEAVSATFEITGDCGCCDQFTVSFNPVCTCDQPTAGIVCPNQTDGSMVTFDVSGTPSAGHALTVGTYVITLEPTGTPIEVGTVGNPANDTVVVNLGAVAGQEVTVTYTVRDDCDPGNVSEPATCTFTVPCAPPTATITCEDPVVDSSNVTVSWTATPSPTWTLLFGGIEIFDGSTQVGFYFVPFPQLDSGSTTFNLSSHGGKTLTARYTVNDTCGGPSRAVECDLVIPCDLPTATVDCDLIGSDPTAVMISVGGASPHGTIVSGTLEILDSSNMVVASAMPLTPSGDTESLNLTGLEGQSLTATYFVEDDCGTGGTSLTVNCPFVVPDPDGGPGIDEQPCSTWSCPTLIAPWTAADCGINEPTIQFLGPGSEWVPEACPNPELREAILNSGIVATGLPNIFGPDCVIGQEATLSGGGIVVLEIDFSGTNPIATVSIYDANDVLLLRFTMSSPCSAPFDPLDRFDFFFDSGSLSGTATACVNTADSPPSLIVNSSSTISCT